MHFQSMHLISWNVAGRRSTCSEQIDALERQKPDVVALQEVRKSTLVKFQTGLPQIGLEHMKDSVYLASQYGRPYGQAIASRWPLEFLPPTDFDVPFPERMLSVILDSPWGPIELHTAHIPPGSSNGWIKIETFEGIFKRLACKSDIPRILCGDFNTPQAETPDGQIVTWGQTAKRHVIKRGHKRWDAGERSVVQDLAEYDLPDVFRSLHGYQVQEFSWCVYRKGRCVAQRRFDHIFASKSLNPVECKYLHPFRTKGLSDHSAIEARFRPQSPLEQIDEWRSV
jgi:exonuclease III